MPVCPLNIAPVATVELPPIFRLPELPNSVPPVSVRFPVKVFGPVPRSRVPVPEPLMVSPPPLTLPLLNTAVPVLLVIETRPVVVNPLIF